MSKSKRKISAEKPDALFGRIVSILEEARGNVVRAVNTNMVMAYWLIGREIVQEVQSGEDRRIIPHPVGGELSTTPIPYPAGTKFMQGFSPEISWSHYRALMRVDSVEARNFYEKERRLIEATLEERDSE
jgi:hypothetical protein